MVEHRSPKPGVVGSIPAAPAISGLRAVALGGNGSLSTGPFVFCGAWGGRSSIGNDTSKTEREQAVGDMRRCEMLMTKTNPMEFARDVRREVAKVTWPTRKETLVTTSMVFLMVIAAALFFLAVDQLISVAIRFLLGA